MLCTEARHTGISFVMTMARWGNWNQKERFLNMWLSDPQVTRRAYWNSQLLNIRTSIPGCNLAYKDSTRNVIMLFSHQFGAEFSSVIFNLNNCNKKRSLMTSIVFLHFYSKTLILKIYLYTWQLNHHTTRWRFTHYPLQNLCSTATAEESACISPHWQ